jgi:hypothetical protein
MMTCQIVKPLHVQLSVRHPAPGTSWRFRDTQFRVVLIACARREWRPLWAHRFSCAQLFFLIVGARDISHFGRKLKFPPNSQNWIFLSSIVFVWRKIAPFTMETIGEDVVPTVATARRRKTKDLPQSLSYLTEDNFRFKIHGRLEADNKDPDGEVMVAHTVDLEEGEGEGEGDDSPFELNVLTIDQMRKLCRNVGVSYVNKCNKFQCRKALWVLAKYQENRNNDGREMATAPEKMTNNIIRLTNIIFSNEFYDAFIKLNDIKTRTDHERHALPHHFWNDVAEAMNSAADDDSTAIDVVLPTEDLHYEEVELLNLLDYDIMTDVAIKKKIMSLFKVRKIIQENMTLSGEHDSDVYNFVEVAMKKAGTGGFTLLGCYYFFKICDLHPEVDVAYSVTLDDVIRGNTDDNFGTEANSKKELRNDKKRAYAALTDMGNVAKSIASEMKETNRLALESTLALKDKNRLSEEKNKLAKQSQLIAIAQALGRQEILEDLLLQSYSGGPSAS